MGLDKKNLRYNILIVLIYIIGIIFLIKLFSMQIVHGEEYREISSTRLTRETTIKASRGNILDRNENIIASNENKYILEIYRSKVDEEILNKTILNVIKILESNKDEYRDSFPVQINPIKFTIKEKKKLNEWKKENELDENMTAKEVLYEFKDRYGIVNEKTEEIRKIIGIRYGIEKEGYSAMRPYIISKNISEKSVAILEEQSNKFPGISINPTSERKYLRGSLASHIIRIYWTNK